MGAEIIDTFVLQPHAVEHPHGSLCHSGIVISLTGMQGGALDDDAAKIVQIDEISKLKTISEGP